jgi:cholest-4-en-3-one 26-monooxygenase
MVDGNATKDLDLLDARTFEHGFPHEYFADLRARAPVHWHPGCPSRGVVAGHVEPDQQGFWIISRYDDVRYISRHPELFSSQRQTCFLLDYGEEQLAQLQLWMVNSDHPRHTLLRSIVNKGFTPRTVAKLERHIAELSRQIVERAAPLGSCDFVSEFAAELPLQVIAELMGCPAEDRHKLFHWTNCMVGFDDPDVVVDQASIETATLELFEYASNLAEKRQRDPQDDLCSVLVHAEVDGTRLSELERNVFFQHLVAAGNETTRNALAGGMLALIEHPRQRLRLLSDPSLLETAVEEVMRWVSPVTVFRRTATCATEIAGQTIAENDKVAIYYASANRDERVFPEPQQFDVARKPNDHLGFGFGAHYCLGASLARLEIRALLAEVLRHLPSIELDGPVRRLRSHALNGIVSMPVRLRGGPLS